MQRTCLALLLVCGLTTAAISDAFAQTAPAAQKSAEGDDLWDALKNTTNADLLRDFLEYFPDSRHAAAARARLATVTGSKPPSAATAPPPPPAAHTPAPPAAAPPSPAARTPAPPAAVAVPPPPPATRTTAPPATTPPRQTTSFPQPRQGADGAGNLRVDWCLNWGTNCGKPAAEAFCQARGFKQAQSFQSQQTGGPTWVAGDQKICMQPACTALTAVTCEGEAERRSWTIVEEIPTPTINHLPVATCLLPSRECGKPAADSVCRAIGFLRATHFAETSGTGPIVHFGDGTNCTGDQCRALKGVICSRGTSG